MCFHFSLNKSAKDIKDRFKVKFDNKKFKSFYYTNAFNHQKLPVISNEDPKKLNFYTWGLIPFWIKTEKDALSIRDKTCNARSETIFEKPSYRAAVKRRRCLVIADGFFEWHNYKDKKYPFYIGLKGYKPFAFAGIWEEWRNPDNNKKIKTFSIITTDANPLVKKIHNVKKRMPVILTKKTEKLWLKEKLSTDDIMAIMQPYDEKKMTARPVSRLVSIPKTEKNVENVIEKFKYEELNLKKIIKA